MSTHCSGRALFRWVKNEGYRQSATKYTFTTHVHEKSKQQKGIKRDRTLSLFKRPIQAKEEVLFPGSEDFFHSGLSDGFRNDFIDPIFLQCCKITFVAGGSHHHDATGLPKLCRGKRVEELDSVHHRHVHIQQDKVGTFMVLFYHIVNCPQCLFAIVGHHYLGSGFDAGEYSLGQEVRNVVIVHHKYYFVLHLFVCFLL